MNAASAVTSGFVFGGQLAFVSSVESNAVLAFILSKIAGGIVAMLIAILLSPENVYEENTILERS